MILVGNKSDLEHLREIQRAEAEERAAEWGVPYLETSAKTKENVDDVCFNAFDMGCTHSLGVDWRARLRVGVWYQELTPQTTYPLCH